jgi:hypothetical protein
MAALVPYVYSWILSDRDFTATKLDCDLPGDWLSPWPKNWVEEKSSPVYASPIACTVKIPLKGTIFVKQHDECVKMVFTP